MKVPKVITHKNMKPLLDALQREPYFQCGNQDNYAPGAWFAQTVTLEVPTGELCDDGLKTIALRGRSPSECLSLTGKEGFAAQGLEGKVAIRKSLFAALMNLRDLIPENRGRIVTR